MYKDEEFEYYTKMTINGYFRLLLYTFLLGYNTFWVYTFLL